MARMIVSPDRITVISLPVNIFKSGKHYIADCPALRLSTQGKSIEKVKKAFDEAFDLWLEAVIEHDTLRDALLELGWEKVERKDDQPATLMPRDVSFRDVPISILAQHFRNLQIPTAAIA